jgi:hypothetical protein
MTLLQYKSTRCSNPWPHYEVKNLLNQNDLQYIYDNISSLEFIDSLDNHRLEHVVCPGESFLANIVNSIFNEATIQFLSYIDARIKYKDKLLRVSLWKDYEGFNLPIHTDSSHKLFTMQIYLPQTEESNLGTSFFDEHQQLVKTTKYDKNCGYYFFPNIHGIKTWHTFNLPIQTERCSLIFNIFDKELYIKKKYNEVDLSKFFTI